MRTLTASVLLALGATVLTGCGQEMGAVPTQAPMAVRLDTGNGGAAGLLSKSGTTSKGPGVFARSGKSGGLVAASPQVGVAVPALADGVVRSYDATTRTGVVVDWSGRSYPVRGVDLSNVSHVRIAPRGGTSAGITPIRGAATTARLAAAESEVGMAGGVIWFNADRGFGFIRPVTGNQDLFFTHSSADRGFTLRAGDSVSFKVIRSDRGLEAIDIYPS